MDLEASSMTVMTQPSGGGRSGSLYDVIELILDRGLVIDAFVRVSLLGIEVLAVEARVVVASVDTYLRFAQATSRIDVDAASLEAPSPDAPPAAAALPELVSGSNGDSVRPKARATRPSTRATWRKEG
jgi:gas vesicle structural protein